MAKPIRVQLDIAAKRVEDIDKLQAATGSPTRKDVFENAMTLFEWCVNEVKAGRKIVAIPENLSVQEPGCVELNMPALDIARPNRMRELPFEEMDDTDKLILKAALAALRRERHPLPEGISLEGIERLRKLLNK